MPEEMQAQASMPSGEKLDWVKMVVKVQAGVMTATEAAEKMGVSRKTYYKWERRIMKGMMAAAEEKDTGRPAAKVDPEKEQLKKELEELKERVLLLRQELHIKDALRLVNAEMGADKKKD